jgi:hypothetical protein
MLVSALHPLTHYHPRCPSVAYENISPLLTGEKVMGSVGVTEGIDQHIHHQAQTLEKKLPTSDIVRRNDESRLRKYI